GMSDAEYRTHLALWAVLAAPLMAGNDLRAMTAPTRELLTSPEVIAIDQDALGRQGRRLRAESAGEVWVRDLAGGAQALALTNHGEDAREIAVRWTDLGMATPAERVVRSEEHTSELQSR